MFSIRLAVKSGTVTFSSTKGNGLLLPNRAKVEQLERFTRDRPLMLITDFPAHAGGGGAVIIRSLLPATQRENVIWATLDPAPAPASSLSAYPRLERVTAAGSGSADRSLILDTTIYANRIAQRILELARGQQVSALWVVLHGAAVPVASHLIDQSDLSMHVTVHDDPAFAVALMSRRYLVLTPWIEHQFARVMRSARSVDVVGTGMADRYARRYGRDCRIVHRALDADVEPSDWQRERDGLSVAVLGNLYQYSQLPMLGHAVAAAAATIGVRGRIVVVGRSYGERFARDMGETIDVETTGHLDENQAIARLRRCFALYASYPFSRRARVLRTTSFPTKLSTYVMAARPLFLHSPMDSSVHDLADPESPAYVSHWSDEVVDSGRDALVRLWKAPDAPQSFHAAANRMRLRFFNPQRNRGTLYAMLDDLVSTGATNRGPAMAEVGR